MHERRARPVRARARAGDRLLLCSDGASGVLDDDRLADILGDGHARLRGRRAGPRRLDAGSTDNVTCVVADVVDRRSRRAEDRAYRRRSSRCSSAPPPSCSAGAPARRSFRGHRSGDTGELEPVDAEIPDDLPCDHGRPGRPRGGALRPAAAAPVHCGCAGCCVAVLVVGLVVDRLARRPSRGARASTTSASTTAQVAIYRGVEADVPGMLHLVRARYRRPADVAASDRLAPSCDAAADVERRRIDRPTTSTRRRADDASSDAGRRSTTRPSRDGRRPDREPSR